ncbi:DUF2188 domain-containing protein [Gracilibacillus thailandensis]|uniref:DUF2188 domain-containing protein n=1 Tax=Gracilibacillus thailandensis TaxID=563735 RepID=UPI0036452A8D
MRVTVSPAANGWQVKRGGQIKSRHNKKRPAINSARSVARSGDQLVIQRSNGQIQRQSTVR